MIWSHINPYMSAKNTVTKQSLKRKRDSSEKSRGVCSIYQGNKWPTQISRDKIMESWDTFPHYSEKHTWEFCWSQAGKSVGRMAIANFWYSHLKCDSCVFHSIPQICHQKHAPRPIHMKSDDIDGLNLEMNSFLDQGIIGEFKKGWVIVNLRKLKPQIEKQHLKMETIKDVNHMMPPNCLFGSIDFKHAFFSVCIYKNDRKYLHSQWRGKHYQFTSLPQGLGPASRLFTKLFKPVLAHMRSHGLEISAYM